MTYAQISQYFEDLINRVPELKDFFHGDYNDINENDKSSIQYPCLWIETPDAQIIGDEDSHQMRWSTALVVLSESDPNNKKTIKYEREITYRIAVKVLQTILYDATSEYHNFQLSNNGLVAIPPRYADHLIGWQIPISIDTSLNCTAITSGYQAMPDPFEITVADNQVSVVSQVSGDWSYSQNNGSATEITNQENLSFTRTGNIYITQTFEWNGQTHTYSCYLPEEVNNAKSVPFEFNPYNEY